MKQLKTPANELDAKRRKYHQYPEHRKLLLEKNKEWRRANAGPRLEYQRRYYKSHKDILNAGRRTRRYGPGAGDLPLQGKCAICLKMTKVIAIDHCHLTKRRRGLLCRTCNLMIGFAHDDTSILEQAITYLRATELAEIIKSGQYQQ